jgi:hypothetical protein
MPKYKVILAVTVVEEYRVELEAPTKDEAKLRAIESYKEDRPAPYSVEEVDDVEVLEVRELPSLCSVGKTVPEQMQ